MTETCSEGFAFYFLWSSKEGVSNLWHELRQSRVPFSICIENHLSHLTGESIEGTKGGGEARQGGRQA